MPVCDGYEIVCPDGNVRYYPFHNEDDAQGEAVLASLPLPRKRSRRCKHVMEFVPCSCTQPEEYSRPGCSGWPEPSDLELRHPPCPGGEHIIRPIGFIHSDMNKGAPS